MLQLYFTTSVTAGAKLKETRKSNQLSSFKVSHALNIPRKYIKRIERGDYAPTKSILITLGEHYQLKPQILLDLYSITKRDDIGYLMYKPQFKSLC